jgi:hypothetical protein
MFLDKAFFTLNFKWKALKIALKNMTVTYRPKCLPSEHVASPRLLETKLYATCPLFKENSEEREKT